MSRTARRNPMHRHRLAPGLPFGLSDHAIEQLRDRVIPQFTIARCWVEAKILARTATRTERRTGDGCEIWIATNGAPVRFIVRNEQGRRTCVTVLAPAAEGEGQEDVA